MEGTHLVLEQIGSYNGVFYSCEDARKSLGLREQDSLFASDLDTQLVSNGIAKIEMPIPSSDFATTIDSFETTIAEHTDLLSQTADRVDLRHGNDVGYQRKERKFRNGLQAEDAKSIFHFSESVRLPWTEHFKDGPQAFKEFLDNGFELHAALIALMRVQINELEETHPNISKAYFPSAAHSPQSLSFLRLAAYDSYLATESVDADVAKPHFDIGGFTIQAWADAPGFWAAEDGYDSERQYFDPEDGVAQMFAGIGHKKLYGPNSRIKPKWHGVGRIIPEGKDIVPSRHSVILFQDAPLIDFGVTPADTLPHLVEIENSKLDNNQQAVSY